MATELEAFRTYNRVKKRHPEVVILVRNGSLYATYKADAKIVADACGLHLSHRHNNKHSALCTAFGMYSLYEYLNKIISTGHRLGITELD